MQTKCLYQVEGWRHMGEFDDLQPYERELVREAKYNLCCACLWEQSGLYMVPINIAIKILELQIENRSFEHLINGYSVSYNRYSDAPKYMRNPRYW